MNAAGEIGSQKTKPGWRWKWFFVVPGFWILLAELAHVYPGGENLNLAIGTLPALLMANLSHSETHWSFKLILIGTIPMLIAGIALDLVGVSKRGMGIGILAGMIVAATVIGHSFLNEAFHAGLEVAARRFDLDQPKRVVALSLSCVGIGFYAALILAILLNPLSKRVTLWTDRR